MDIDERLRFDEQELLRLLLSEEFGKDSEMKKCKCAKPVPVKLDVLCCVLCGMAIKKG